ncbi:MAG: hypothetical protein AAFO94_05875 [Bacteroidota bacterium]
MKMLIQKLSWLLPAIDVLQTLWDWVNQQITPLLSPTTMNTLQQQPDDFAPMAFCWPHLLSLEFVVLCLVIVAANRLLLWLEDWILSCSDPEPAPEQWLV